MVNCEKLLVFLKGAKKEKLNLQTNHPDIYEQFLAIWNIRNSHIIDNLPSQYVFMLKCCYKPDCMHPVCKNGKLGQPEVWYEGGPLITTLPFPVKDENRPGHYKSSYVNIDDPKCVESIKTTIYYHQARIF